MPRSGSKKSGFLNIPARLILRENDNATGSYPTTLRMGDKDRRGSYSTQFDDTNTITFGRRIRDNFELRDKDKVDGILGYTKKINTKNWIQSGDLEIRKELFTTAGGSTARDGALVLAGAGDAEGRWLQTKEKIKNPTVLADIIFGPYNESRTALGFGLGLKPPATDLKVQVSTTGLAGSWTTIKTLTGNVDALFAESAFSVFSDFSELLQKRKRTKIKLTPSDFSGVGSSEFYLRFAQTSVTDSNQAEWAIGYVNIDYHNENVNYPLMIDATSRVGQRVASGAIASPHTLPTITAPGRSISGISDVHVKFTPGETLTFFDDSRISITPENYFFQQGSDPDIVPGMSSPLWSKTQIVVDLSPNEETTFGMTTPSATVTASIGETDDTIKQQLMVYWNKDLKRWEKIAQGISGNPASSALEDMIASGALGFSGIDMVSTGSTGGFADQNVMSADVLNSYARPTSTFGFPFEGKYHATGSQLIKARDLGICKPFILEKCQINFDAKFEFGEDSSNTNNPNAEDAYSLLYGYANSSGYPSDRTVNTRTRIYIPTFFMLRQQNYDNFSLPLKYDTDYAGYLTESIRQVSIPNSLVRLSKDNESFSSVDTSRELMTYGQITLFVSASVGTPFFEIRDALDKGLSRDAEVNILQANGQQDSFFASTTLNPITGSYSINFPSRTIGKIEGGSRMRVRNTSGSLSGLWLDNKLGGRSYANLDSSARSIVNGTPNLKKAGSYNSFATNPAYNSLTIDVATADSADLYSPYIIMPDDDIVFGWQYPMTNMIYDRSPGQGANKFHSMTLFNNASLTLFGSQLQDNVEFHETVNQNLGSDAIHEMIGSDPVVDQFDLSRSIENYGNYLDSFIAVSSEEPTVRVRSRVQSRLTTPKGQGGAAEGSVFIANSRYDLDSGGIDDGDILILKDHLGQYGIFLFFETYKYGPDVGSHDPDGLDPTTVDNDTVLFSTFSEISGYSLDYSEDTSGSPSAIEWRNVFNSIESDLSQDIYGDTATHYELPSNSFSVNIYGNATSESSAVSTLSRLSDAIQASSLDITPGTISSYTKSSPYGPSDRYTYLAKLPLLQGANGESGNTTIYSAKANTIDSGLPSDSYEGFRSDDFSGGIELLNSSLGSFVRVSPLEDATRIYSDSLLVSGTIDSPFGPDSAISSFGTMLTEGLPIRPKYYFDSRNFGQYTHFLDQAKDSKTTQGIKTRRSGLLNSLKGGALTSPVVTKFVSGTVSNDTDVKTYTAINAVDSNSVNKTINSVLTGGFWDDGSGTIDFSPGGQSSS